MKRKVNIGMLESEDARVGDCVLMHVGFAMTKIDAMEAEETLRLLREMGSYETELDQKL